MKFVLVFASVVLGVWGAITDTLLDEKQHLYEIHFDCQIDPDTYATRELLQDLFENINNPQLGAHMLCVSKAVGLQNQDGGLELDVIKSKIALSVKNKEGYFRRLVRACVVRHKTPQKTAVNLFSCLGTNGVTYFEEFGSDPTISYANDEI